MNRTSPQGPAREPSGPNNGTQPPSVRQERRGRRHYAKLAANVLPYSVSSAMLDQILRFRSMQKLCFRYYVGLITRFLHVIDTRVDEELAVRRSLYYGALRHYSFGPWATAPASAGTASFRAFAGRVEMEGTESLRRAVDQKRGVILVRDHDNVQSWFYLLRLENLIPQGIRVYMRRPSEQSEPLKNWRLVQQLMSAKQALKEGGVVTIAGDGHHGRKAGIEYDFHGRCRPFRSGFAELALMTGASVFAPVGRVDPDGIIRFTFVGPFDPGSESMMHDDRIRCLVDQFVALLREKWADEPWLVPWIQMEKHLAYSHANSEDHGPRSAQEA